MIKKFFKWLIVSLLVTSFVFVSVIGYKKYRLQYKEAVIQEKIKFQEALFQEALVEAAKFPDNYWDQKYQNTKIKSKYKVVFIASAGGEYNYAEHFKYAAEKIGWEVKVYSENANIYDQEIVSFDPDFILFTPFVNQALNTPLRDHRSRKYLINFGPLSTLRAWGFINHGDPYAVDEGSKKLSFLFNGVLSIGKEMKVIEKIFNNLHKPFNGIGILPVAPALINEASEPKSLMWGGMGWDKFRSSDNYKKFIALLSKNVPMKVYGPYSSFYSLPPHVYDGYTKSGLEQIEAIRKNGIYLLTHSDLHIKAGIPSLRIFEATAANAVVISDMHPFAIENFGDSFLYFDQNADAETMYSQVKAHMDWIKSNPEKAKAMANRAHKIFLEKFTLDKDLNRIAKMHESVLAQEKEMGLSYPLVY